MRKTRSDSVLLNLPEEKQAQLAEWLLGGMPYHQAQARLKREWGISVGLSSFSAFWSEVCGPALLVRRTQAVSTANSLATEARKTPGRFDSATLDALQQKAFELVISPNANPKDVKALYMLVLKAKDQDLGEQQLRLDRERFEFVASEACLKALPALKAIAGDKTLDQTAKIDAIRRKLFGTLPEEK